MTTPVGIDDILTAFGSVVQLPELGPTGALTTGVTAVYNTMQDNLTGVALPVIINTTSAQGSEYGQDDGTPFNTGLETFGGAAIQVGSSLWRHHLNQFLVLGKASESLSLNEAASRKWYTYVPLAFLKHYTLGGVVFKVWVSQGVPDAITLSDGVYLGISFPTTAWVRQAPTLGA